MSAHTPGPWELWDGCSWRRFGSRTTGNCVCQPIVARDGHPDLLFPNGGQSGPDARLITAAPDLYEAVKAFMALDTEFTSADERYVRDVAEGMAGGAPMAKAVLLARAALAKAEGKA